MKKLISILSAILIIAIPSLIVVGVRQFRPVDGVNNAPINVAEVEAQPTETPQVEVASEDVVVRVTNTRNVPIFEGSEHVDILFYYEVTNNTDQTIRGIRASTEVYTLFGTRISLSHAEWIGEPIAPGQTLALSPRVYRPNNLTFEGGTLIDTNFNDLIFKVTVTDIIFE